MKPFLFACLGLAFALTFSCTKSESSKNAPDAVLSIIPVIGDTSMVITFDATGSTDAEDASSDLMYSWDLLGTHEFSSYSKEAVVQYQYEQPGSYQIGLQVMDTDGWVGMESQELFISDTLLSNKIILVQQAVHIAQTGLEP